MFTSVDNAKNCAQNPHCLNSGHPHRYTQFGTSTLLSSGSSGANASFKLSASSRVSVDACRQRRFRIASIRCCALANPSKFTGVFCGSSSRLTPVRSVRLVVMNFSNLWRDQCVATQDGIFSQLQSTSSSLIGLCSDFNKLRLNFESGSFSVYSLPTVVRHLFLMFVQSLWTELILVFCSVVSFLPVE